MVIQEDYLKNIFDTAREGILVLDANIKVLSANRSFFNIFKVASEENMGYTLYELQNGQWNIPVFRVLLEDLPSVIGSLFDHTEFSILFDQIGLLIPSSPLQRLYGGTL